MAQFEQHFVQDLTQPIKVRHCGTIVFNADNESNVISVRLFNGSEPVAISGSVVGAVVCSDGSTVTLSGSYSGNTASITLTGDCFAILGQIGVGIQIVNGTQKTTVLKAIYNVETLTTSNVVDPGSRITLSVSDLIDDIETAVASIPADYSDLLAAIAPNYSGLTFPVKAGTFCWYNGALYQAQQDIATSESWTAAHWASAVLTTSLDEKLADVDDELSDLKSAITLFTGNQAYTDYTKDYWIKYTAPQTKVHETGWESILVPCSPGDVFNVKGYSGASPRLWCFSDSQGNAIKYAEVSTITSDYIEIVAPENSAYLACNSKYSEIPGGLIKGEILKKQVDTLEESYKTSGFNQLIINGNFETSVGWIANGNPSWTLSASGNVLTATVKSREMKLQRASDYPSITVGHKYYVSAEYYGSDFEKFNVTVGGSTSYGATTANTWNKISAVVKAKSVVGDKTDCQLETRLINNYTATSIQIRNYWVVDLTSMYGEGNEPTSEEFAQMYSENYYPFLNMVKDPRVTDFIVKKQMIPIQGAVYGSFEPDGYEPGYIGTDGGLNNQSSTIEVTSTPIYDVNSAEITITFAESQSQWLAFCAYNNIGQKVGDRQTISGSGTTLSGSFTLPSNASYFRFSFRTYGIEYTLTMNGVYSSARVSKRTNVIADRTNNLIAKMGKPCYDHLFVQNSGSQITIPHQSPFDVRAAKRFGFNMIEGNVQSTSDGHYFVNHLDSDNKFGRYFTHVDGTTDISNVVANTVTWAWILENVRYKSSIAKYRTPPCSLEDFLSECRQNDLVPFLSIPSAEVVSIADKYMGKDNYIAYTGSRLYCPTQTCYAWKSELTKDSILKFCIKMGKPLIYGIANPGSFTDAELREIVDTLHENGFMIGTAYQDTNWHKYAAMGFDFVAGMGMVNRMSSGNLHNFNSIFNWNDFTATNATETDGTLVFSSDGTIVPNANTGTYQLAMIDVEVVFAGTITLNAIGEQFNNMTFASDGTHPVFMPIPIVNGGIKPTINVSAGTTIYEITYLASVV